MPSIPTVSGPMRSVALVVTMLLVGTGAAASAFTTDGCLAQKRKAWRNLRNCQGTEEAKQLTGRTGDLAKCQTRFQDKLAKISDEAAALLIACRYHDGGDATVLDYDTGLQWERKDGTGGGANFSDPHDVDNAYSWSEFVKGDGSGFLDRLNDCKSPYGDGTTVAPVTGGFAGHCDWRLPSVTELLTILVVPYPCGTSPCIDPIFGPTAAGRYWSATGGDDPSFAWFVNFNDGFVGNDYKPGSLYYVRAVRAGL